jgi:hypothetical protein
MKDKQLRLGVRRSLDSYKGKGVAYIEKEDYFILIKGSKQFHYYPEESEWCNGYSKTDKMYPCKGVKHLVEDYLLEKSSKPKGNQLITHVILTTLDNQLLELMRLDTKTISQHSLDDLLILRDKVNSYLPYFKDEAPSLGYTEAFINEVIFKLTSIHSALLRCSV